MTKFYQRLLVPPDQSFFLFGIRGIGKSLWSQRVLEAARRFDLLDEGLFHQLVVDPGLFGEMLEALQDHSWVIVDEVQRLPLLLNEVHRKIESKGLKFALLGSSARKLLASGVNLLAGRALRKHMFPLVPEELGQDFDLEATLERGSIPLVLDSSDPEATLRAYVQMYIREEIKAEALVRNLPGFIRFLQVAAVVHGETINVSGIARDSGVARTTVDGYIEILEDTLLVARLPGYEAKLRVRERRHPKLYWTDPGLVRAVRNRFGPLVEEETGPLFEGWIFTLLRTYNETRSLYDEIAYWAPVTGSVEVDFLLRRGDRFLAIEVKSSHRVASRETKGLRAIGDLDGVTRRLLIYRGAHRRKTEEGIEILPVSDFLADLAAGTLWPTS